MAAKSVNVLVTSAIGEECLRQIADISPRIKLTYAPDFSSVHKKGLVHEGQFDTLLAEAEIIYGLILPPDITARAPKLKWVQLTSAGVDHLLGTDILKSGVTITNTSGIHAVTISEFALELMLMFAKQAPLCFRMQQQKQWQLFTPMVLHSKTVGIVGLGRIGREVARLAKAFGMRVMATRRSIKRSGRARYVDQILPREQLDQLLSDSDFVVLALPLTSETSKLIGEKELRTMKSTAYLINIARGNVVDEALLIRALDEGWIAGAGLDVFATEPLPADSRLWEFPNVIIIPHVTGWMEDYYSQATGIFCENLRRYLSGKKLFNVVDKKKGY